MRPCRRFSFAASTVIATSDRDEAIHRTASESMNCFAALAMTGEASSPQMLPEKLRRAAPGEFGALPVMHGDALLVHEGMLGVIAKKFERFAGDLHRLLEGVDRG